MSVVPTMIPKIILSDGRECNARNSHPIKIIKNSYGKECTSIHYNFIEKKLILVDITTLNTMLKDYARIVIINLEEVRDQLNAIIQNYMHVDFVRIVI